MPFINRSFYSIYSHFDIFLQFCYVHKIICLCMTIIIIFNICHARILFFFFFIVKICLIPISRTAPSNACENTRWDDERLTTSLADDTLHLQMQQTPQTLVKCSPRTLASANDIGFKSSVCKRILIVLDIHLSVSNLCR